MKIKSLILTAIILAAASVSFAESKTAFTQTMPFGLTSTQPNLFADSLQNRYSLTITNRSKWSIYEVYVETSENKENWGKERLAGRVLEKDTYIVVSNLKPGEYDVRFVDEGNDECILENIAITKNTSWEITTRWLEKCATR
jgi:hypothetical protein